MGKREAHRDRRERLESSPAVQVSSSAINVQDKNIPAICPDEKNNLRRELLNEDAASLSTNNSTSQSVATPSPIVNLEVEQRQVLESLTEVVADLNSQYDQNLVRVTRELKAANISLGGIAIDNQNLEEQKSLLLGAVERTLLFWRKSNNQMLAEMQQANLERQKHLEAEIARFEKIKKEQEDLKNELQQAQEQLANLLSNGADAEQVQTQIAAVQGLVGRAGSAATVEKLKQVNDGYISKLKQIGEDADKLAKSAERAATVAKTTRNVAIGTGAVIATGGTIAAVGGAGAVIVGTGTGTLIGAAGQVAEQGLSVGMGQKDKEQAIKDGLEGTKEAALTSSVAAVSTVGGAALARGVTSAGGKIIGSSQLASKIIPQTGLAARVSNTLVTGSTTGASYGALSETAGTMQQVAIHYYGFSKSEEFQTLSAKERYDSFLNHLAEQGITLDSTLKNTLHSSIVGALSGTLGATGSATREVAKSALGRVGTVAGESIVDTGIGVGSAVIKAQREGRDATFEELTQEISASLLGTSVGAAAERINAPKKSLKPEAEVYFERQAQQIGAQAEKVFIEGRKKTVYAETLEKSLAEGKSKAEAASEAKAVSEQVTAVTIEVEIKGAATDSANATAVDLKKAAGKEGLTAEVYDKTLAQELAAGKNVDAAKQKAEEASLEHSELVTREISTNNTEKIHDELFKKFRLTEGVEVLVRESLLDLQNSSVSQIREKLIAAGVSKDEATAMAKSAKKAFEKGATGTDQRIKEVLTEGITQQVKDYVLMRGEETFVSTFKKNLSDPEFKKVLDVDAKRCGKSTEVFTKHLEDAALKGYQDGVYKSVYKAVRKAVEEAMRREKKQKADREAQEAEQEELNRENEKQKDQKNPENNIFVKEEAPKNLLAGIGAERYETFVREIPGIDGEIITITEQYRFEAGEIMSYSGRNKGDLVFRSLSVAKKSELQKLPQGEFYINIFEEGLRKELLCQSLSDHEALVLRERSLQLENKVLV